MNIKNVQLIGYCIAITFSIFGIILGIKSLLLGSILGLFGIIISGVSFLMIIFLIIKRLKK